MKKIDAADGSDYLYEKHGKKWRVRVRVISELLPNAPVNGDVALEASGVGLAVSVALLDDSENVAIDPHGRFRVFPAHVLTLQAESLKRVDPEKEIQNVIHKQIDEANEQVKGKDKLYEVLAAYN